MKNKEEIKLSVRRLVEFVLKSGDLNSKFVGNNRALEGSRIHRLLQIKYKDKASIDKVEYKSEQSLKYIFEYKGFNFLIEGRADGIIVSESGVTIDEIKTTTMPLESIDENYNALHWAQAKCYAYIYAIKNGIEDISVQLTYYNIITDEIKYLKRIFKAQELKDFFYDLIERYFYWANYTEQLTQNRNESIRALNFPFEAYRQGQREIAVAVYTTIKRNKKIFIQAPTGIGKTISTIFPTIKAIGEGLVSKILYLTAKNITSSVVVETLNVMKNKGLKLKTVIITAKQKICFKEEPSCNPEDCKFAKGHYDRVNEALFEILNNEDIIDRNVITKYAEKYEICPFEFSLEIASVVDFVVCDYNYVFDPSAYLRGFFEEQRENYVFLIDECHNLIDRSREMFSSELYKKQILSLKKIMKDVEPSIASALNKINSFMVKLKKMCENNGFYIQKQEISDIYLLLKDFIRKSEDWLAKNENMQGYDELLELYFNVIEYIKISELYDENFVTYVEKDFDDVKIKMFCVDPSNLLKEILKRGKSSVFFSATLTPMEYFKKMLGGEKEDYVIKALSPFSNENKKVIIANRISTKYKNRINTYTIISEYINCVVSSKKGNYLVFFPSYEYMEQVYNKFCGKYSLFNTIIQKADMGEDSKEAFLENFNEKSQKTMIGFVVLGGMFSEGIDLKGEKLIGAIVVGVGLPKICLERNIIKDYFNLKIGKGYEYSYMYPGMSKVLQAAGRVIRTKDDRGIILLIDERFTYNEYKKLFPTHLKNYNVIKNKEELKNIIYDFWKK